MSHLSDLLRFVTLRKYGGTYLDLDLISLKSLKHLGTNFLGAQSNDIVNGAVLNVVQNEDGLNFLDTFLYSIQEVYEYDPFDRNALGPTMVTEILHDMCNVFLVEDMVRMESCEGIRILPVEEFYPVSYDHYFVLLHNFWRKKVMPLLVNSTLIHIWNHYTDEVKVKKGGRSAYDKIVQKQCPRLYQEFPNFF